MTEIRRNPGNKRRDYPFYIVIKTLVRIFYPRIRISGAAKLPEKDAVIVANHSQMNSPITFELYSPVRRYTWCVGEMMELHEVPEYAFRDFWSEKPLWNRWFFKGLSYVIAPLAVCVFNNADTIAVYHDARLVNTFRESMERLQEGADIVIFPECDRPYNHILYDFQDKFVDIARFYYRKTGKELQFVPAYMCPELKRLVFGKPVRFDADSPVSEERERICTYLKQEITRIAEALPEHTVVPYRNVPRREYPKSRVD